MDWSGWKCSGPGLEGGLSSGDDLQTLLTDGIGPGAGPPPQASRVWSGYVEVNG